MPICRQPKQWRMNLKEATLYEGNKLRVSYMELPNDRGFSHEDHELWLLPSGGRYPIKKGILKEDALLHITNLQGKLRLISPDLLLEMAEKNISVGAVELAFKLAYIGEEKQYIDYLSNENRTLTARLQERDCNNPLPGA